MSADIKLLVDVGHFYIRYFIDFCSKMLLLVLKLSLQCELKNHAIKTFSVQFEHCG